MYVDDPLRGFIYFSVAGFPPWQGESLDFLFILLLARFKRISSVYILEYIVFKCLVKIFRCCEVTWYVRIGRNSKNGCLSKVYVYLSVTSQMYWKTVKEGVPGPRTRLSKQWSLTKSSKKEASMKSKQTWPWSATVVLWHSNIKAW